MAEIQTPQNGKKKAAKPDMTPLVDLGFLLITFFIYTTTFNQPSVLDFATPKSSEGTAAVNNQNTLTLILGGDNKVYWYQKALKEVTSEDLVETDYSSAGIRQVILEKKKLAKNPDNRTIIIKPTEDATWENAVDVLDETIITGSKRKAITELTPRELEAYQGKMIY
ncbi:ExbD/TolR family protein [Jiulongibacter sediminis]|uniref:Biopolymer transporter ExbD n=1 Tax=Jiulongibacter sediminis TaxID=1605367 RepID=A0A0P7BD73_9BACT|nr:biopolymer transporter ExbD [Jiulongibacter sediminis]KPM48631.1 hypothetical protein AFM12_08480 [Jiulongibacter sediminis]TBX25168.1 hypothetical protein TK44_08485 [Jiulongibacter sediminis]